MLSRRVFLSTTTAALASAASSRLPTASGPLFIVASLTMQDARGKFDDALQKDYLAYLAAGGADGVLIMGTTGEFSSFSAAERKQVLESSMRHRGKLAVMCHVGACNLPDTLDLMEHATHTGVDSILVVPPYYYKNPSVDGLAAFFEPILRAARLPVLLYNIPQNSGAPITPELLRRLSSFEHLYGMKDSFSNQDAMLAFIRDFPNLKIMTGVPGNIAANLQHHGAGGLTGNGSVFVKQTTAIFTAWRTGGDVLAAQKTFDHAAAAISGYGSIPDMKAAMTKFGLKLSGVRPPYVPMPEEKRRDLLARL